MTKNPCCESQLPEKWVTTSIGTVSQVVPGYGFPEKYQGKIDGDIPFFKIRDISETFFKGSIYLKKANNYVTLSECEELRAKPLKEDTIVFAKIGEALKLNRRAILAQPSLVDNNVVGVSPIPEVLHSRYAYYYLLTVKLEDLSRATTVPSVRKSDIEEIKIPLAPLNEQRRIVGKVEEIFSFLDAGVESLRKIQAQLKRYRQTVLKAAIKGDLTKEWRENHQDVLLSESEFAQKIEKEKSSSKTATLIKNSQKFSKDTSNLEKLPEGWLYVPLIQAATLHRGYDLPEHKRIIGPFPVVASSSILGYHNEAKIKGPGVITGRSGTIGEVRYIEPDFWPLNTSLYVCDFHNNNPKFISLLLQSLQIQRFLSGTGVPTLNRNIIHPLPVPLPQLPEQLEIVLRTEPLMSIIEQTALSVAKSMSQAHRLRQSILMKAFRGELCTQDPNDEPAEKLLERIKDNRVKSLKSSPVNQLELSSYVK